VLLLFAFVLILFCVCVCGGVGGRKIGGGAGIEAEQSWLNDSGRPQMAKKTKKKTPEQKV